MTVSYILFSYATVTGFGYDVQRLGDSRIPFIDVAQHTWGRSPSSPTSAA